MKCIYNVCNTIIMAGLLAAALVITACSMDTQRNAVKHDTQPSWRMDYIGNLAQLRANLLDDWKSKGASIGGGWHRGSYSPRAIKTVKDDRIAVTGKSYSFTVSKCMTVSFSAKGIDCHNNEEHTILLRANGCRYMAGVGLTNNYEFKATCRDVAKQHLLDMMLPSSMEKDVAEAVGIILRMNDRELAEKVFRSDVIEVLNRPDCTMVDIIICLLSVKNLGVSPHSMELMIDDYKCYMYSYYYPFTTNTYGMYNMRIFVFDKTGRCIAQIDGPEGVLYEMMNIAGSIYTRTPIPTSVPDVDDINSN